MDSRIDALGHKDVGERFRRALARGRLASSFLFVGPPGVGKRTFAVALAQSLLCEATPADKLQACGTCPACQQVAADSHPDFEIVRKPDDRSFLPIELLVGDREHRMQKGLCHNIGLKPFRGGRKVAIIDDADFLNQEGANCLLKTLEEPPPKSVIVLISSSEQRQLPTIRSRCQVVRFRALPTDIVETLLLRSGQATDASEARRITSLAGGSLTRASEVSDPRLQEFRAALLDQLARPEWNSLKMADEIGAFVNEAGKDAPPRRERLRTIVGFALDFYRQLLRDAGDSATADRRTAAVAHLNVERVLRCMERCLDADAQVLANANQTTLIESFVDDLAPFPL